MVFWDLDGILAVDYMQQKTTITRDACAAVLQNLKETVKKKMRGDEYLLFHNNAPVCKS